MKCLSSSRVPLLYNPLTPRRIFFLFFFFGTLTPGVLVRVWARKRAFTVLFLNATGATGDSVSAVTHNGTRRHFVSSFLSPPICWRPATANLPGPSRLHDRRLESRLSDAGTRKPRVRHYNRFKSEKRFRNPFGEVLRRAGGLLKKWRKNVYISNVVRNTFAA